MPIVLTITDAGEAAVSAATGSDPVVIAEIGLSNTPFVVANTLTALPGEFKRIPAVGGAAVAANRSHLSALDTSAEIWSATGFGAFLDDGTLFAVYSGPTPVLTKAELAFALLTLDIAWEGDLSALIDFGNPLFTNPQATESTRGVARIADDATADAGIDHEEMMTAKQVKRRTDALLASIAQQLNPAGKVSAFATAAAPAGWLACNGAAVARAAYPALFAAIGVAFGPGDGATTFNLPDARDRVVFGAGGLLAVGATGGTVDHDHGGTTGGTAITEAQMPAHDHAEFAAATSAANIGAGQNAAWSSGGSSGNQDYDIKGTATAPTLGKTSSTGGGAAHDHTIPDAQHIPPFVALLVCIKT